MHPFLFNQPVESTSNEYRKIRSMVLVSSTAVDRNDHQKVTSTDAASKRHVLRAWKKYEREIIKRSCVYTRQDGVCAGEANPMQIEFGVYKSCLESPIDPDLLTDLTLWDQMDTNILHVYMENEGKETREVVTTDQLDKNVTNKLSIDLHTLSHIETP